MKKIFPLLGVLFCLLTTVGSAKEAPGKPQSPVLLDPIFVFSDHFVSAEAVVVPKDGPEIPGEVAGEEMEFSGLSPESAIRLLPQNPNGKGKRDFILFNPVNGANRRLVFRKVPAGSTLVLHYKVQGPSDGSKEPYLFFRIRAGKHELRASRIFPDKDGWQTELLPLGIVSFLNHDIPVTFELNADSAEDFQFLFAADILP